MTGQSVSPPFSKTGKDIHPHRILGDQPTLTHFLVAEVGVNGLIVIPNGFINLIQSDVILTGLIFFRENMIKF